MGIPHVLAIPYPAQGHVIPLMEIALCLAKQGIEVTFVNTEFNHERVAKSLSKAEDVPDMLQLVSIPDGLESWEDRNDVIKLGRGLLQVLPVQLESLIKKINQSEDGNIACIIADYAMGLALEVAVKMEIRGVAFWSAAAAQLAQLLSIPKLMDDGIIDNTGTPLKKQQMIQLSPDMIPMDPAHLVWTCMGDADANRTVFDSALKNFGTKEMANFVICNSSVELERAAFSLYPEILPIGPLLASNRLGKSVGHFWHVDSDCLTWLDKQPPQSVIYIAFGSFTVFDQTQFRELALGLELTNMPFLWVVRQDLTSGTENPYPDGFKDRIRGRGRLAGWVPQQKVLSHPSVACFLSHCGWNSTMEGVSNGLPFLCWPYFVDQSLNKSYICDVWKVGLGFSRDENGIVGRGEIKSKIEQLLADREFKARALDLKAKVMDSVEEDGSSGKNFNNFIKWIKDEKNHSFLEKALVD